jgi:hypothetical protein
MIGLFLLTYVQMCKPVAGLVTENLREEIRYDYYVPFSFSGKRLTVPEILLAAFQQRYGGRKEHSARGKVS